MGVLITLISAALGFLIITPGAVFWSREAGVGMGIRGRVSASGPVSNLLFAGVSLIALLPITILIELGIPFGSFLFLTASLSVILNLILGGFNMLPIAFGAFALDGAKVVDWDARIWVAIMGLFIGLGFFCVTGFFLFFIQSYFY